MTMTNDSVQYPGLRAAAVALQSYSAVQYPELRATAAALRSYSSLSDLPLAERVRWADAVRLVAQRAGLLPGWNEGAVPGEAARLGLAEVMVDRARAQEYMRDQKDRRKGGPNWATRKAAVEAARSER